MENAENKVVEKVMENKEAIAKVIEKGTGNGNFKITVISALATAAFVGGTYYAGYRIKKAKAEKVMEVDPDPTDADVESENEETEEK